MTNIIRAEFLKSKRTMSSKLIVVFPIITLVMAFVLTLGMTNAYAESAWNWWYVLLLPGMIAIVSYLSVIRVNITVRQSRQSGVARATCPD